MKTTRVRRSYQRPDEAFLSAIRTSRELLAFSATSFQEQVIERLLLSRLDSKDPDSRNTLYFPSEQGAQQWWDICSLFLTKKSGLSQREARDLLREMSGKARLCTFLAEPIFCTLSLYVTGMDSENVQAFHVYRDRRDPSGLSVARVDNHSFERWRIQALIPLELSHDKRRRILCPL